MQNFKIVLEYDGTHYYGWQIQKDSQKLPTVQGCLTGALKKLFGKEIVVTGAGRTDTRVHALGQTACFKVDTELEARNIFAGLNRYLPCDIRIKDVTEVSLDFHPIYSAKRKHYRYIIEHSKMPSVFNRFYTTSYAYDLNIQLMKRAAKLLKGKHDFSGVVKGPAKNKVRIIYKMSIVKKGNLIQIDVIGNGFLYKMVRRLVGVLSDVGRGKLKLTDVKHILAGNKNNIEIQTAPAQGLMLMQVDY